LHLVDFFSFVIFCCFVFFFFQAEDGIRDGHVTGVQTCALPILDTDVALADMTSGRTVLVGAEYGRGVHDAPPGCAWKTLPREVCLDPRLLDNFTAPRFGVELSILLFVQLIDTFTVDRSPGYDVGDGNALA